MSVFQKEFKVETKEKVVSYVDITQSIKDTILESGIKSGTCTVVTAHTTCSIFFEEDTHDRDEDGVDFLQLDLNRILENIVPPHVNAQSYKYPGEAHYKEGYVYFADFDKTRERTRKYRVIVMGE